MFVGKNTNYDYYLWFLFIMICLVEFPGDTARQQETATPREKLLSGIVSAVIIDFAYFDSMVLW